MLNLFHDLASGSKMGRGENVGEKMGMGKKLTKIDYLAHMGTCSNNEENLLHCTKHGISCILGITVTVYVLHE